MSWSERSTSSFGLERSPNERLGRMAAWRCYAGVFIGAISAGLVGMVLGGALGFINERCATGEEYEELFIGFAEYSAWGFAFFGALGSAYGGAVGGGFAGFGGASERRVSVRVCGGIVGAAVSLTLWGLLTGTTLDRLWRQENVVWAVGTISGSVAAGVFACFFHRPT